MINDPQNIENDEHRLDAQPRFRFEDEDESEQTFEASDEERSSTRLPVKEIGPMKKRRRLLVIAYYYPPMGFGGVYRIAKFTKYLPQHGWDPTVLTVGDIGYLSYDYSLLEEVLEAGVVIERTKTLDPLRLLKGKQKTRVSVDRGRRFLRNVSHAFLQPDNKVVWKRYALKRAGEILEREEFDAILATAPPFTDFLIGLELQQKYGLPLVVDYRDPWTDNRSHFYATPLHRSYAAKLEETVLKNAEGVVVGNRRIKERLIARHAFLTHGNVHIIPSGYDPQDFRLAARYPISRPHKMRLTYSGLFDGGRSPKFLFAALARIFAKHPESRDEIELCFIGSFSEANKKLAAKLGVASALVTPGYLEHHQSIRYLMASDVLWLTLYDPAITPGIVYEYIGTRKPILALVPQGSVRQMLEQYGAAVSVEPENVDAISDALHNLYQQWRSGELPTAHESSEDYEHRRLTERLARVLAYSLKI